jgi:Ala-tRNA(Pro) deacylase
MMLEGYVMPVKKLKEFIDSNGVRYISITHSKAFTAQEVAASAHISGQNIAKTVMVKLDGVMAMTVLPATRGIDFDLLAMETKADSAVLADEEDFKGKFPDTEIGAMPPFGNLYGIEVYVDSSLTKDKEIAFNAGSHTELIKLSYKDYVRLVKPKILKFSYR